MQLPFLEAADVSTLSSLTLNVPRMLCFTGTGALTLTNGGSHVVGVKWKILIPAGTASSLSRTGMPETAGGDTFDDTRACLLTVEVKSTSLLESQLQYVELY